MSQNDLKIISALLYFIVFLFNSGVYSQTEYVGVNLAGAEFGENNLLGTYNQHYTYPTRAAVDYFVDKGMNVFRLPFRWERLQHTANAEFNSAELSRIKILLIMLHLRMHSSFSIRTITRGTMGTS